MSGPDGPCWSFFFELCDLLWSLAKQSNDKLVQPSPAARRTDVILDTYPSTSYSPPVIRVHKVDDPVLTHIGCTVTLNGSRDRLSDFLLGETVTRLRSVAETGGESESGDKGFVHHLFPPL